MLDHPVVKALPVEVARQGFERFQVLVDIEIALPAEAGCRA
jgi:hypothetical protein